MRAVLLRKFGPASAVAVEEVPIPSPGPDEVRIDIEATALNFVDLLVIGGTYQFLPKLPFVPGKLPVGVISAVGAGVDRMMIGRRVLTLAEHGGYAEQANVAADACFTLPAALSYVDAAAMALAYDTAWFALCERGRAKAGEAVLVLGASGAVGLAAVQLAKAYGMRVFAGIHGPARADVVLGAGADSIIDLSVADLRDGLRRQIMKLTNERGIDVVLDPLGGDIFDAAIRAVAWRGRVVVIGFAAGRIPTLKVNYVMLKNIEVSGLQVSDYRKRAPDEMSHCLAEIFRLYEQGKLRPAATITVALEEVGEALTRISERRASTRLVMTPKATDRDFKSE
jgi:NADPH2:quinone reductase